MNRIQTIFKNNHLNGKKTLIGYATAGCPDSQKSFDFMRGMIEGGVEILELGVPFSDPTADGSIIQEASQIALRAGMTLQKTLLIAEQLRKEYPNIALVLFSYYNPIFHYGLELFAKQAHQCGIDAVLIVDVPLEEQAEVKPILNNNQIELIPLVSPATSSDRMKQIVEHCKSFIYYITVRGVTGTRRELPDDLQDKLTELRSVSSAPLAAGFGISTPEMASTISRYADAIVIGSAFVRIQKDSTRTDQEKFIAVKTLASACSSAMRTK